MKLKRLAPLHAKDGDSPTLEEWNTEGVLGELHGHASLKDVKDVKSLAKQFIDSQAHIGQSIRIPGEDAGEDAIKQFQSKLLEKVPGLIATPKEDDADGIKALMQKLGAPTEIGNYPEIKGVPEDITKAAHEANLTVAQYKKVAEDYLKMVEPDPKAQADFNKELNQLYLEWGGAKPDKIAQIGTLMRATGAPEQLIADLEGEKVGAATLRWMDTILDQIGGDTNELIKQHHDKSVVTAKEAEQQLSEIRANPAFFDRSAPNHVELVNKSLRLQAIIVGEDPEKVAIYR